MKLVVALDLLSRDEIFSWSEKLSGLPVVLKIGLRNLPQLERGDVSRLKDQGFGVFIDTKLHDIPTQVAASVTTWAGLGADYLTLHLSGGRRMLEAAVEAQRKSGTSIELFGVSVLTSMSTVDINEIGVTSESAAQVERLIALGLDSGMRSFVCSALEVEALRKLAASKSKPIHFVCPGLIMKGESAPADQKRVATIEDAARLNIDWPVVGRSILKDPNPRAKTEKILALMSAR